MTDDNTIWIHGDVQNPVVNRDGVTVMNVHRPPPEDSELRARLEELAELIIQHARYLDHPRRLRRQTEGLVDTVGSTDPKSRERILLRMAGLRAGLTGTSEAVTSVGAAVGAVQSVIDRIPFPR
jgi:hypothetical protein